MRNAILYVPAHRGPWRGWPEWFGPWYTVHMRLHHRNQNGVLDRVFTALQEEQILHLRDGYTAELLQVASEQDLTVHLRDGQLISHPSIVRIMPGDRAVRIDRKKTSGIRPSSLVALLLQNQRKQARYKANLFLEALYKVYVELTREESKGRLIASEQGRVVPLTRIYGLFTSLPGSSREYSSTDFARDIFMLDQSGVTVTRSGFAVSFPSSTGTRSTRSVFSFVGPDGQDAQYYGVRFVKVDP